MDPDAEIEFDFSPFLRLYKSGHVHRLFPDELVPAAVDPDLRVASRDVVIDPSTGVAARLYLPSDLSDSAEKKLKLPVVVYIHGGAFVIGSAFSSLYHNYLNFLVAKARVFAVSVDYRLAPEHLLPAAYDDAFAALQWVASHAGTGCGGPEPWLTEYGDFGRVFLAGDSAGGNIAHNIAMRTGSEPLANGVEIEGLALLHPYFLVKDPAGDPERRRGAERSWMFICGGRFGAEDPAVDPVGGGGGGVLRGLPCRKVVVTVGGKDVLREKGRAYYERVKEVGWEGEAELVESEGKGHVFFLGERDGERAVEHMAHLVDFFNRH